MRIIKPRTMTTRQVARKLKVAPNQVKDFDISRYGNDNDPRYIYDEVIFIFNHLHSYKKSLSLPEPQDDPPTLTFGQRIRAAIDRARAPRKIKRKVLD